MKKNIIFDLDGTICFDGVKIDERLVDNIIRLVNTENVIFASARPIRDMLPVLERHKELTTCCMIGGNGTIIKHNDVVYTENINKKVVDNIVALTQELGHKVLIDSKWNYYYNGDESHSLYTRVDVNKKAVNLSYDRLEEIIKVVVLYNEVEKNVLTKYDDYLRGYHTNVYESEKMFDVLPADVNKFTALNKHFEIMEKEYIAFGNDINDIELLKNAKRGYVVGNTIEMNQCENLTIENLISVLNEL